MLECRLPNANNQDEEIQNVSNYMKSILGNISEYEVSILQNAMRFVTMEPPSTKLLITERINQLIKVKSELQYLVLKCKEIRRSYNIPYVSNYNKFFTLGTKKGLPSKQAIESEMHYSHPDMVELLNKIEDIDNLLEFLSSFFILIDRVTSTLESRRYDL